MSRKNAVLPNPEIIRTVDSGMLVFRLSISAAMSTFAFRR